ncbi:DUF1344 domain-containing protein [Microvirga tunisiensis]|uniref:DUF1344 domain-containing protein n=2 Tax=Pannonibacter tanglangensis TaxID=2750084 RepID=A0ABW9ZHK6_9HYPH|nr:MULTISPECIES: DUF1344 domain-containing protein [unclassified Pannonibacter]NBN64340.1 DUF1344 domain-containing protein [Pannonibacter sp. XCT-34]NBN78875.1 DUF1344 domain-containing protein [Pannonibacter sp. XCT-53]
MKSIYKGLAALGLAIFLVGAQVSGAAAEEAEGKIVEINPDTATITLSDGQKYEFPVDFYVDDLKPGQTVRVYFDVEGGKKKLYDLQIL